MGEFPQLQKGDSLNNGDFVFDRYANHSNEPSDLFLGKHRGMMAETFFHASYLKTVHRSTIDGIKQVWPEVEGNSPTFEEALEATIGKYGDALSRLAGTEEVQP